MDIGCAGDVIGKCIKPNAFGNALGSSLAEANSTEKLRSADNLAKRGGMTQTALGELNALAGQYGGHENIPYAELKPYIGLGQGNNPTIGALYDNEATQRGFVGTRLGAPPTNTQIDLPEFTVAPDLTINVPGSSDMFYQAGRAIAVSGGVVAGMFQNIGDGIIGAGKFVYEGLQAQQYIMLGGDNSVNRYVPGYEIRQEAFENFKSYGSAMRTIASDPGQFLGNAIGHTFDGIQSKLSTAESTTELGDWFMYGASVGHATMGVATVVAGGVGLARSAVSGIGALRTAVGTRIAARTAALDVSQNPFGVELSRGGSVRVPTSIPKGIYADNRGVYGYLPAKGSAYDHALFDFTDTAFVARNRQIRLDYIDGTTELEKTIASMRNAGKTSEEIGTRVVIQRNSQKMEARAFMTDPEVQLLESRNIKAFENPNAGVGPTPNEMFKKYGDWDLIIQKSLRKDPEINLLLGINPKRY